MVYQRFGTLFEDDVWDSVRSWCFKRGELGCGQSDLLVGEEAEEVVCQFWVTCGRDSGCGWGGWEQSFRQSLALVLVGYRRTHRVSLGGVSLGADPYLPSRYIESFLRVFKQFACNIPRG